MHLLFFAVFGGVKFRVEIIKSFLYFVGFVDQVYRVAVEWMAVHEEVSLSLRQ